MAWSLAELAVDQVGKLAEPFIELDEEVLPVSTYTSFPEDTLKFSNHSYMRRAEGKGSAAITGT